MARSVKGRPMPWSQQEGTEEPETKPSAPQQEEQPDTTEGEVITDFNPDVDYEGQDPRMSLLLWKRKRKILMQSMQTWRYLEMGLSARG